ncbi:MAG: MtaA/CmuA family methyltransferase [Chloroflexi bacterium]|nr:MtaA/CmuA family methyltransferase [Chloroflexota bacterium]
MAALRGEPVDRPPAASITSVVSYELMDTVGVHFPAGNVEPEPMATLAAAAHDVIGFDSVMPIFSIAQEATALGCRVDWSDPTTMPNPSTNPWRSSDVEMKLPDGFPDAFLQDRYVSCAIEAIGLLKKHFGDRVAILGKVMGPWTLSYHLCNVQEFLYNSLKNPDRVRRSLEVLKAVPLAFAQAQIQAGADAIVWADHATGDLVRASMYRDLLLPLHQELIPKVPVPVILHCCGPTLDRIRYFREPGFAVFHFESKVPAEKAVAETGGKLRLAGNINNPVTLLTQGPAQVRVEAQRAIDAGVDIISPECAVPLQTAVVNLKEIVRTCEQNRKR